MTSAPEKPRTIALFDVDGTLTVPRGEITESMMDFMKELSKKITVGIVGGSDLPKQEEQLGQGVVNLFPYNFSQNGLVAYKNGELLEKQTISKFLGEDNVKRIVNWVMKYLSEVDIPVKVWIENHYPFRHQPHFIVPFAREGRLSSFGVECSTFLPLVATALDPNGTTMRSLILKTTSVKTW